MICTSNIILVILSVDLTEFDAEVAAECRSLQGGCNPHATSSLCTVQGYIITCTDNSIYMCELDYKVTSDADNNPELNVSLVT